MVLKLGQRHSKLTWLIKFLSSHILIPVHRPRHFQVLWKIADEWDAYLIGWILDTYRIRMSLWISREEEGRWKKFYIFTCGKLVVAGTSHITFVPTAKVALVKYNCKIRWGYFSYNYNIWKYSINQKMYWETHSQDEFSKIIKYFCTRE